MRVTLHWVRAFLQAPVPARHLLSRSATGVCWVASRRRPPASSSSPTHRRRICRSATTGSGRPSRKPPRNPAHLRLPCGLGAHLDTTAGRCGSKPEIRNPESETNSNAQWSKAQNRQQGSGFGHSLLGAWGLFRTSSFGLRVSALWIAVVSRCTRGLARRSNAFTLGGGLAKLADSEHTLLKSLAAGHRDALDRAGGGQIGQ